MSDFFSTGYKLSMPAGAVTTRVHLSQYDTGLVKFVLNLFTNGAPAYIPDGASAQIVGVKPSGNGYTYDAEITADRTAVVITATEQMTAESGVSTAQIVFTKDGELCGSCNFKIVVEADPVAGAVVSESDYSVFYQAIAAGSEAAASATNAAESATAAAASAESAETAKTAAESAQTAAETAKAETEALFPDGGTAGQVLTKTESGAEWQDSQGGGGNDAVELIFTIPFTGDPEPLTPINATTNLTEEEVETAYTSGKKVNAYIRFYSDDGGAITEFICGAFETLSASMGGRSMRQWITIFNGMTNKIFVMSAIFAAGGAVVTPSRPFAPQTE